MCPTRPDVKATMDHLNWFPMSPELKHKKVSFRYKLICERKQTAAARQKGFETKHITRSYVIFKCKIY